MTYDNMLVLIQNEEMLATFVFKSTRDREIDPARTAYITTSSKSMSSVEVNVDRTSRRRSAAGAKERIERR
jgi:hypothetical protein